MTLTRFICALYSESIYFKCWQSRRCVVGWASARRDVVTSTCMMMINILCIQNCMQAGCRLLLLLLPDSYDGNNVIMIWQTLDASHLSSDILKMLPHFDVVVTSFTVLGRKWGCRSFINYVKIKCNFPRIMRFGFGCGFTQKYW